MPLFDEMFETFAQPLVENTFGQRVRLVIGSQVGDWFDARRITGRDQGDGEHVPEVAEYHLWDCAVADVKVGGVAAIPKAPQLLETQDAAGNPIYYQINAAPGEPAVVKVDQDRRYRIRTQRTGS